MTDKADQVKRLLENPVLQEAFENARLFYLDQLENMPINSSQDNINAVLDLKKMLRALEDVKATLHEEIQRGIYEDFQAAEEAQPAFLGDINGRKAH